MPSIPRTKFTDLAQFQPKQKEAWYTLLDPACKYLLYGGAAYGGKSYFLRWGCIGLGMYYYAKYGYKNIPIGLFSEDYPTLKDRQVIKMKNEIPAFIGRVIESRDEGYAFIANEEYGKFIIMLRNLDDPSKYSSVEFAAIAVEEITKNKKDTFDDLRFRMRYPGISDVKFMAATNPGSIGHGFVKKLWVAPDPANLDHEQDRFKFVPAYYSDNKFVTDDYVKQLDSLPEDKRRAYKDGSWDTFAGQYFPEWNLRLHTCKAFTPPSDWSRIGSFDWGYTAPFAYYSHAIQKVTLRDGRKFIRVYTYKELYGVGKTPEQWAERIMLTNNLNEFAQFRADPSIFNKKPDGSVSIADQMNTIFKENAYKLKPANNDRLNRWAYVHKWLSIAPDGLPYWIIMDSCPNLIRTLPEMVHDENKIEDLDSSAEDHGVDGSSYGLVHIKWIDGNYGTVSIVKPKTPDKFYSDIDVSKFEEVKFD